MMNKLPNQSSVYLKMMDFAELLKRRSDGTLSEEENKSVVELWHSILNELLLFNPFLSIDNMFKSRKMNQFIEGFWHIIEPDEMEQYLVFDSDNQFLWNAVDEHIERLKTLKPPFIIGKDIKDTECEVYLKEIIKASYFGLFHCSVILSCALIEDILKKKIMGNRS